MWEVCLISAVLQASLIPFNNLGDDDGVGGVGDVDDDGDDGDDVRQSHCIPLCR